MAKWHELLSGNQLKIIALVTMTIDHVGRFFFPQYRIFSVIGRLSFPIFAYMIAEGCRYTKNRTRYLMSVSAVALLCQIVYYIAQRSLFQCVLVSFSLAIGLIFSIDYAKRRGSAAAWSFAAMVFSGIVFVSVFLPKLIDGFVIDYGLCGILLPCFVFLSETKPRKLLALGIGLVLLSLSMSAIQWFSLFSLMPLSLYSSRRGKYRLKSLFYIYYPAHLAAIYLIGILIS